MVMKIIIWFHACKTKKKKLLIYTATSSQLYNNLLNNKLHIKKLDGRTIRLYHVKVQINRYEYEYLVWQDSFCHTLSFWHIILSRSMPRCN